MRNSINVFTTAKYHSVPLAGVDNNVLRTSDPARPLLHIWPHIPLDWLIFVGMATFFC